MKSKTMLLLLCVSLLVPSFNVFAAEENFPSEDIIIENDNEEYNMNEIVMPEGDYLLDNLEEDGINIEDYMVEEPENVGDAIKHPQMREGMPFSDVASNSWYYPYVKRAYEYGHMDGQSSSWFNPNGQVTRAMAIQMLYNLAGKPDVAYDGRFNDVSANAWYSKAIAWGDQL